MSNTTHDLAPVPARLARFEPSRSAARQGVIAALDFVLLPGGSFVMGNDNGRPDERPAHRVTLPSFRAARRPVTNAGYVEFLVATGHEAPPFIAEPRFTGAGQPVVGVSWFEAIEYCVWLSTVSGLAVRLPTEAEREYAALGGLESVDWPWGDEAPSERPLLHEIAPLEQPHVPSDACTNGYGLMCMADNVHEWCSDWYAVDYYVASPADAPLGPESGHRRSSRGGSWRHQIKFNRISSRSSLNPAFRYNDYGFRVYADAPLGDANR